MILSCRWLLIPALTGCTFTVRPVPTEVSDLSVVVEPPDLSQALDLLAPDLAPLPDLTPAVDLLPEAPCPMVPSLVGCWRFENGITDSSMYGNDGTASNAAFVPGVSGQALLVAGNTVVTVPDDTSLDVTSFFTFEAWVQVSTFPGAGLRAGIMDNDGQYGLFVLPQGVVRCTPGGTLDAPAGTLTTGVWAHIACTYDGATMRIYKNGNEVASAALNFTLNTGNANGTRIGSNSPTGENLAGQIDELRIWNVGRSQARDLRRGRRRGLLALYNACAAEPTVEVLVISSIVHCPDASQPKLTMSVGPIERAACTSAGTPEEQLPESSILPSLLFETRASHTTTVDAGQTVMVQRINELGSALLCVPLRLPVAHGFSPAGRKIRTLGEWRSPAWAANSGRTAAKRMQARLNIVFFS